MCACVRARARARARVCVCVCVCVFVVVVVAFIVVAAAAAIIANIIDTSNKSMLYGFKCLDNAMLTLISSSVWNLAVSRF